MNRVILSGRLTKKPEVLQEGDGTKIAVTRYILAVPKRIVPEVGPKVDYITVTAFGNEATFAARWFETGTKVLVMAKIQTGSYTNKEGQKVYTTDIVAVEQEFGENKARPTDSFVPTPFKDDLDRERPIEPPEPERKGRR